MHNVVLPVDLSMNMKNDESTEYKTVRGLTRGLMLLNMLNRLDGGASVGLLAELSGLHRTTVRRLLEMLGLDRQGMYNAVTEVISSNE